MNLNNLSCGGYLQTLRLAKKIRLERVAQKTCISLTVLQHIEHDAFDKLPPEVFVRGFVRAYACNVGADEQIVLQKLARSLQHYRNTCREADRLGASARFFRLKLGLVLLLLCGIIGLSVVLTGRYDEPRRSRSETATAPSQQQEPLSPDMVSPAAIPAAPADSTFILEIHAHKETWLKIIVDAHAPQKYDFTPGDSLRLSAMSNYNMLIGDATALVFTLNGQIVRVVGRSGQTVHVRLPQM